MREMDQNITQFAEGATQTNKHNIWLRQTTLGTPIPSPIASASIPLSLRISLIEESIKEIHKRKATCDLSSPCELERCNKRVYTVSMSQWIVFLDTESGVPVAYHALPLSVWNEIGRAHV